VLAGLSRRQRQDLLPVDVLGILAPLLIGFRFARGREFVQEANRHKDASQVMARLLGTGRLVIEIPLCAHRASPSVAPRGLAHEPDGAAVQRVCGLLRLLLGNSRVDSARVNFLQQGPSARAASCMFPSVFLEYVASRKLDSLLSLLAHHQSVLRRHIAPYSSPRVQFALADLDSLSKQAEADLQQAFGPRWQQLDAADASLDPWADQAIGNVVKAETLGHVARFMPEVGRIGALQDVSTLPNSLLGRAALAWFARRSTMSAFGRALFEIAFYRRWALRAKQQCAVGLGFDRDFSPFQRHAWHLAYGIALSEPVPLLYARRTLDMRPGGALRHISFRQFWVGSSPSVQEMAA